jgi:hypothetical protein
MNDNAKWFDQLKLNYSDFGPKYMPEFDRLIAYVEKLQKRFKELKINYHSCLHPTPYLEREFSKDDEGDWQYETLSYLPLRKVLQNDNARLQEENKTLKAELREAYNEGFHKGYEVSEDDN